MLLRWEEIGQQCLLSSLEDLRLHNEGIAIMLCSHGDTAATYSHSLPHDGSKPLPTQDQYTNL